MTAFPEVGNIPICCTQEDVEPIVKHALKKTGHQKETDLCGYIPDGEEHLSPGKYFFIRNWNQPLLKQLITHFILDADLKPRSRKKESKSDLSYTGKSLEDCVKEAMAKLNVQKETALCKYIPYEGGYIHHFTYLRMKTSNPIQARNLIKENILDQNPKRISPKPRKKYKPEETNNLLPDLENDEDENLEFVIFQAMRKKGLSIQDDEDLCRYIPQGDSFLHPLVFRSIKKKHPERLACLIKEYVLKPAYPKKLQWKRISQNHSGSGEGFQRDKKLKSLKIDHLIEMMSELTQTSQKQSIYSKTSLENPNLSKIFYKNGILLILLYLIQNQQVVEILKREVNQELWAIFVGLLEGGKID